MNSCIKYSQIKNLSDLKAERTRVAIELEYAKRSLSNNCDNLDKMLSFGSIAGMITNRSSNLFSLAHSALAGFDFVKMLIDRFRYRRRCR